MCGRYASFLPAEALRALFQTVNPTPNWEPTWNMAPTRDAPVVRLHPETRARHLDLLRWGLVPHWAKDAKSVRQPINARAETVATAPMFRDALVRRRCLVPADVFYEWQATEARQAAVRHRARRWPADGVCRAVGGLARRRWHGDATFTIVTTNANPVLRPLHERMPVILEAADWPAWLGEVEGEPADLLRPSETELRVWQVGTAVNNVRNDNASLLEPRCSGRWFEPAPSHDAAGGTRISGCPTRIVSPRVDLPTS